jgi:hypothetical protein
MKVYPKEIKAGLEEVIKANNSIAFVSEIKPSKPLTVDEALLDKIQTAHARAVDPQFDLYYMTSILASIGWNKNDDIFTVEDSWNARGTPVYWYSR